MMSRYEYAKEETNNDRDCIVSDITAREDLYISIIEQVKKALKEIQKGEGAYSLDPLTHAGNCIENMKDIAEQALKLLEE